LKTAARLAAEMRALEFEVTEKVGKTELVAIYKNGDGPTIMVRTELDALPMEEKTGLAYASHDKITWNCRETFVAHSCGHDIHMAQRRGQSPPRGGRPAFDMLARMSTSVSIAGFACRIAGVRFVGIDQMLKAGPDGRRWNAYLVEPGCDLDYVLNPREMIAW
jgi:hypothetical protein